MTNIPSSSSSNQNIIMLRNPTPPRISSTEPIERSFPQPLPDTKYAKDSVTKLRHHITPERHKIKFVYSKDLKKTDKRVYGTNNPMIVKLENQEYVYKENSSYTEHLPKNHERHIFIKILYKYDQSLLYSSHSRVMMQIMSRKLLKLFLKDRQDVILPKIYPVVDKKNSEICGSISKKLIFVNKIVRLKKKLNKK